MENSTETAEATDNDKPRPKSTCLENFFACCCCIPRKNDLSIDIEDMDEKSPLIPKFSSSTESSKSAREPIVFTPLNKTEKIYDDSNGSEGYKTPLSDAEIDGIGKLSSSGLKVKEISDALTQIVDVGVHKSANEMEESSPEHSKRESKDTGTIPKRLKKDKLIKPVTIGMEPRPTHFVAIQITNPEIKKKLNGVQETILKGDPKLLPARVKLEKLHVTIAVMHVKDEEELEKAKLALESCYGKLREDIEKNPLVLHVSGVSSFSSKVVFANITGNEARQRLLDLAEIVADTFEANGIKVKEDKPFAPHLTLFKLSQSPQLWKRGIRKIDSALYKIHAKDQFGLQKVNSLQLLIMTEEKDPEGYYLSVKECFF